MSSSGTRQPATTQRYAHLHDDVAKQQRDGHRGHDCGVAETAGAMMPRRDSRPVRLSVAARRALDEALDPQDLDRALRIEIERHLTDYREAPRYDAAAADKGRQHARELVLTARRLLNLMDASVEDLMERQARGTLAERLAAGTNASALQEAVAARIRQWDRPYIWKRGRAARPKDWRRRILLFRVMMALDAAGVPASCHRDAARVRVLREVLRCADALDRRPLQRGSLRLIQSVYRHYRQRVTWDPDTIQHSWYLHHPDWPDACECRFTKAPSVRATSAH